MCLIFMREGKSPINYLALESAFVANPDGVGLIWFAGGRWQSRKWIKATWRDIQTAIDSVDDSLWAIHFRYATHGAIDLVNCHPFEFRPGFYLMHNGMLDIDCHPDKKRSDTWHYARMIRKIDPRKCTKLLSHATDGSRCLYACPGGDIVRTGRWHEREDGWYSNTSCLWEPKAKRSLLDDWDDNWRTYR